MCFKKNILIIILGLVFITNLTLADLEEPESEPVKTTVIFKGNFNFVQSNLDAFTNLLKDYSTDISQPNSLLFTNFYFGYSFNNIVLLIGYNNSSDLNIADIKIEEYDIINQYSISGLFPVQLGYRLSLFDIFHLIPFVSTGYGSLEYSFTKSLAKDKIDIVDVYNSEYKKSVELNSSMWFWDIGFEFEITYPFYESENNFGNVMNNFGLGVRMGYIRSYLNDWTTTSGIEITGMPDQLYNGTYIGFSIIYEAR